MYYCGVVAYLLDFCVGDFCVYYTVAWWRIPEIPVSGIYFSVYFLGVVADLWDSCVRVFCVHYCGVVA